MGSEGKMTTTDARGWINALIKAMHEETSGTWPDPEYKDEVYSALEMAIKALSQEPCTDAVSREAVIMECIKYTDHEHNVRLKKEVSETRKHDAQVIIYACDYFKTFVEKLPSVTQKSGKWIPVSERLPEDRRTVFVTAYWHETCQVMMASYYGDGLWWCVPFNNCGEHMQRLKPKAWMPIPEPYMAESEE